MLQPELEQRQLHHRIALPKTDDNVPDGEADNRSGRLQNSLFPNVSPNRSRGNSNKPLDRPDSALLHLSFNQDAKCFAAGTDRGFRVYRCDPFSELFRRDFDVAGGIGTVEMLFQTNYLVLVAGHKDNLQYPHNKVMIWDDYQSRCVGELSFKSEVLGVRFRKDLIVVVREKMISVHSFLGLRLLNEIETVSNPKGLCAVSQTAESFVLVCPGSRKGLVRVEHYPSNKTRFIIAHNSGISCLAISMDGHWWATASSKGTLVRIFNAHDGTLLQEVRRGADRAEIYSLAFSPSAQWLAVSSDKGTVHVFRLKTAKSELEQEPERELSTTSPVSSYLPSFMRVALPKYFSSEWSVAQFHLPEGCRYDVAFGHHQKHTVVILGMDGSFYRCKFDPAAGGEMTQIEYHSFHEPEKESL